ncbi:hypothetical protein SLEP1_g41495 [Rubroshorea leprosula]|uniref:Protein kinase domain-containing protein n=1 Tax=Rubroshorea leprosula TaxID=152421 RepID=A0AAV5L7C2_9ROSI|nr:hypothetical protein SLEP1_g41495 [Rubroshorea leprosula]
MVQWLILLVQRLDQQGASFNGRPLFTWSQRYRILKDVASALLYLHEEWEQVVLHRDVKASNVLLDSNLNGRFEDFGLARLHDHGAKPETTNLVGTIGHLAPKITRTGMATTSTDVFAFGIGREFSSGGNGVGSETGIAMFTVTAISQA